MISRDSCLVKLWYCKEGGWKALTTVLHPFVVVAVFF